jgi:Ca2+-binding EF-hand superfamily protein
MRRGTPLSCVEGEAMQISGTSSNSAAWALRQLFQTQQSAGQQTSGAGQSLPSNSPAAAALGGMSGPQMAPQTMSGFMSIQGGPPSAPDIAAQMISSLDTNGDGVISQDEAQATGNQNAAQAFATLDANGDGSISQDELTSAVQQSGPHRGHHRHKGASASDAASALMNALNTDGQDGLSLDEVTAAVGGDAPSNPIQSGFSALDADGDGTLSVSELTSAINRYEQTRLSEGASLQAAGALSI